MGYGHIFDIFLTTHDIITHYLNLNHLSLSQGYFFTNGALVKSDDSEMGHFSNRVIHEWDIGPIGSFTNGAFVEWGHSQKEHWSIGVICQWSIG